MFRPAYLVLAITLLGEVAITLSVLQCTIGEYPSCEVCASRLEAQVCTVERRKLAAPDRGTDEDDGQDQRADKTQNGTSNDQVAVNCDKGGHGRDAPTSNTGCSTLSQVMMERCGIVPVCLCF